MAHTVYENFVLANRVEDQLNSHLDLMRFCTIDNTLVGTAGMKKKIHVYSATSGTEKLTMGQGNSKDITVSYAPVEYEILMAQNRFPYFDEEEMTDPMVVDTGMRHAGVDLFNHINADIIAEFGKATLEVPVTAFNFDAFADAGAALPVENLPGVEKFALVHRKDMAKIRKACKESLSYVKDFIGQGYVATLADWNLYVTDQATEGTILGGTRDAVTLFNKKGIEIEQERDADKRKNLIFSRKYYLAALTDATKAVKITIGG
jgi:hypothetical protein